MSRRDCAAFLRSLSLLACAALVACSNAPVAAPKPASVPGPDSFQGELGDGAAWVAEVPGNWNGTLLLYSHGYNRELQPPSSAPDTVRQALLDDGYALAASAYPTAEWAVAEAIPSQLLVLDAFAGHYRPPTRVIAWGSSMGGMVTSALAERHADRIDGALTMCASSMGALPMMNMAFDGAFALTTLIPADPPVSVLGEGNNFEGARRQVAAVEAAREDAAGRARVALAAVLAGIPGWTRPGTPRPASGDYAAQEEQMAAMIQWGIFLPRGDQERRAGGIFSWNNDIDYAELLAHSGRAGLVQALYDEAGLDLAQDLATLEAAPRVAGDRDAVEYMRQNFTPSGHVGVPVLSLHTIGDGMTSPSLQQSYVDKVREAAGPDMVRSLWIERAGHCTQTGAEMLKAIDILEQRISTGTWPADLLSFADDDSDVAFIDYTASPVPRARLANTTGQ
jgi:pimeloyl-ACP methyl ester carboxylesterase